MEPGDAALERLLVGQDASPMVVLPGGARVHAAVAPALAALQRAAAAEGFSLQVASGFRDFARQCTLWNARARGERPLLDAEERPLDAAALSPAQRVHAILRWSALPGASRHHWGTDVDVYDAAALPPGASPRLTAAEAAPEGPFSWFHRWLDAHLHRHRFYRPYAEERGGVGPEPWHLSFAPLALPLQQAHTPERCARALAEARLELASVVLEELEALWARYVVNVSAPPRDALAPTS